jgi:hypothetical protein
MSIVTGGPGPIKVRKLEHQLRSVGTSRDPLREPLPHAGQDVGQPSRLVLPLVTRDVAAPLPPPGARVGVLYNIRSSRPPSW